MPRLRLVRPTIIAATALLIPALTAPATAAKAPDVPTLAKVAEIYPHLKKGTLDIYPMAKVTVPGKKCASVKTIKFTKLALNTAS